MTSAFLFVRAPAFTLLVLDQTLLVDVRVGIPFCVAPIIIADFVPEHCYSGPQLLLYHLPCAQVQSDNLAKMLDTIFAC